MNAQTATKLSVNLNKVALLRNQRDIGYPGVIEMARIVLDAGAHGITVHPRPDERHIRQSDVQALRPLLREEYAEGVEFNIEGYPSEEFLALALATKPEQVTLVPDSPEQHTSDHGWDLEAHEQLITSVVAKLHDAGLRVSLFMDPDVTGIRRAADTKTDRIELYTEPYAVAHARGTHGRSLAAYAQCAAEADRLGMGVNAGHDLNLDNLPEFRQAVPMLAEVSIGHAITADALRMGFPAAVRAYLAALNG